MRDVSAFPFLNAARARIALYGIRGLSLRSVAQDAGTSLGSLNYRIGDKASLIARLLEDERVERKAGHAAWRARLAVLDLGTPAVLAGVVAAYLDQAAGVRRDAALMGCELLLEAGLDPAGYPGIADLLDEEEDFWVQSLLRDFGDAAAPFGRAITSYCRDEMPFSIIAAHDPDYRLLRASTIERLAEGFVGKGGGLSRHFDALVAACGTASSAAPISVDLVRGSKKAELAGHIAKVMADQGVASVTHRRVAARAGVPNSSVAHHFRTLDDLLQAGMGALILAMRYELVEVSDAALERRHGSALIRATHSIAFAAARDPALVPFAIDMRRRRAENVRPMIGEVIGGAAGLDGAAIQAVVMVIIGASFGVQARGEMRTMDADILDQLSLLRLNLMKRGQAASVD